MFRAPLLCCRLSALEPCALGRAFLFIVARGLPSSLAPGWGARPGASLCEHRVVPANGVRGGERVFVPAMRVRTRVRRCQRMNFAARPRHTSERGWGHESRESVFTQKHGGHETL